MCRNENNIPHVPDGYRQFLFAWLHFAENEIPDDESMFASGVGLCTNLELFCEANPQYSLDSLEAYLESRLDGEPTPFNGVHGMLRYAQEDDKTKNPLRLAFVRRELDLTDILRRVTGDQ